VRDYHTDLCSSEVQHVAEFGPAEGQTWGQQDYLGHHSREDHLSFTFSPISCALLQSDPAHFLHTGCGKGSEGVGTAGRAALLLLPASL